MLKQVYPQTQANQAIAESQGVPMPVSESQVSLADAA